MYTVYNTENGYTGWYTEAEFIKMFGKDQSVELLAGYHPSLVATKHW